MNVRLATLDSVWIYFRWRLSSWSSLTRIAVLNYWINKTVLWEHLVFKTETLINVSAPNQSLKPCLHSYYILHCSVYYTTMIENTTVGFNKVVLVCFIGISYLGFLPIQLFISARRAPQYYTHLPSFEFSVDLYYIIMLYIAPMFVTNRSKRQ